MNMRKTAAGHSDQGPASKDWEDPGSDVRPGRDLDAGRQAPGQDVQPGTRERGKSWQSDRPDPDSPDQKLDKALEDSFPASDPPAPAQPGITGWDADDPAGKSGGKR